MNKLSTIRDEFVFLKKSYARLKELMRDRIL